MIAPKPPSFGFKKNEFEAEHRQLVDEIEANTLESGAKQASQYLDGLASPTSQNNAQISASSSDRRIPDVGMARIYGKILTLLSRIGLREDDITPGHHRIRWKNVSAHNPKFDSYVHSAVS